MKTFTAKQFSRTPGVVFDAARDDGEVTISHGNNTEYYLCHKQLKEYQDLDDCLKPYADKLIDNIEKRINAHLKKFTTEHGLIDIDAMNDARRNISDEERKERPR